MKIILKNKSIELNNMKLLFYQHSFSKRFQFSNQIILNLKANFISKMKQNLWENQNKIEFLKQNFLNNHPEKKLKIGFVQVTKDEKIINIDDFVVEEIVTLETTKHKFECKILEKKKIY
jgi:exodeoxyribonuclease VII large subunit